MLEGWFGRGRAGEPRLGGLLSMPSLSVNGPVSFLVDTGADSSLIHSSTLAQLGADAAKLRLLPYVGSVEGIGGSIRVHRAGAKFGFRDSNQLYVYSARIDIVHPDDDFLPSILGRDILKHWLMTYDPASRKLTFAVHHADTTIEF